VCRFGWLSVGYGVRRSASDVRSDVAHISLVYYTVPLLAAWFTLQAAVKRAKRVDPSF
jgi:hypothetical protein